MLRSWSVIAVALLLAGCMTMPPPPPPPPPGPPPFLEAAIRDGMRPPEDIARDRDRLPVEMLIFSGMRPGWKVADLIPGTGYYTRLLSKTAGPAGHVYAYVPDELTQRAGRQPTVASFVGRPGYENSSLVLRTLPQFGAPELLDMVFIGHNYHNIRNGIIGEIDIAAVNRAVFRSLKPGGVYVVIDYRAPSGSGIRDSRTLNRIDPDLVRREVLAAGFVFDGESGLLANPSDNLSINAADPSMGDRADQFVYRFRKP